jgi:hypothetical protein
MGATSRIVAAVMIGLAVTGCALTRQAEQRREVAQRAAGTPCLVGDAGQPRQKQEAQIIEVGDRLGPDCGLKEILRKTLGL